MMEAWTSPLILTKLRVPVTRPRNIPRMHLVERLCVDTGMDLILVCAPAGYGKTTLLVEWAQSLLKQGANVAWYALDPSDDDPIPFVTYLVESLAHAFDSIPDLARIAQLLRASPEVDLQRILQSVINAIAASDQACVLILDDYHLIAAPAIHSALAFLLEHLPESLRIAIGSRSDPPLPLARLRAKGRLLEVRTAHLRFAGEETAQFLNESMGLDLSPQAVTELEMRTEGWIAGLQLAALSLSGRLDKEDFIASFTGSHRYLIEYLLDEVVNRQPRELVSFLLATSILERMCAPLCDAIVGETSHSEAILERLDQSNLFVVALDDQGYWYRYHRLFRDFLQTRLLRTQPERAATLHREASQWLAAHNYLREAARHALQTQDWDYAAAFVEQNSFTMIIHSEISTIHEWCSAFPEEVMRRHPLLCILQCWAWVLSFRRQTHPSIEARLQQAEQVIAVMEDGQLARELTEHAAVVRTFMAMAPDPAADLREHLARAESMLGTYPEGDAGQFSALLATGYAHMALHDAHAAANVLETARQVALRERLFFGIVESSFHLTRLVHSQGRLRQAAEICRQGRADIAALLTHPEQELPALGCLNIALGCVLLEQDQLVEAERELLHGLEVIGWRMNPYYLMTAYAALARLHEIRGRPAEAAAHLSRLEDAWPDIDFLVHALLVRHALRTSPNDPGTLAEAAAWCQTFSPSSADEIFTPGLGPLGAAEAYDLAYLAWARAQIAVGNARAALPYLERQLDLAETHGLMTRVIEFSLLEALAARALGEDKRTWTALRRALEAAQPEGYLRIFDQGGALAQLLFEAGKRGISPGYIGQILDVIGLAKTPREGEAALPRAVAPASKTFCLESGEHLTEREMEVLHLVALGASNGEIAEELVITVGTVKSHINHILGKLNVHNRTEAVARARGLGLLDL